MKPVIAGLLRQVGLCLALCHMPAALAQSPAENELLLKTAFVFNFAKLTRWPANTWTEDAPMFNLCTAGSDDLVASLRHLDRERIAGTNLSSALRIHVLEQLRQRGAQDME